MNRRLVQGPGVHPGPLPVGAQLLFQGLSSSNLKIFGLVCGDATKVNLSRALRYKVTHVAINKPLHSTNSRQSTVHLKEALKVGRPVWLEAVLLIHSDSRSINVAVEEACR